MPHLRNRTVAGSPRINGQQRSISDDQGSGALLSAYGHIEQMAYAVAEGAREVAGVEAVVKRVPELVSDRSRREVPLQDRPAGPDRRAARTRRLRRHHRRHATRFGTMTAQMRNFWDQTGGLWMKGALVGKVGCVFTSRPPSMAARRPRSSATSPPCCTRAWSSSACPMPSRPDGRRRDHGRLALRRLHHHRRRRQPPAIRAGAGHAPASRASTSPGSPPSSRAERPSLLRIQEAPVRKDRGFLLLQVRRVSLIAFRQPVSSLRDHGRITRRDDALLRQDHDAGITEADMHRGADGARRGPAGVDNEEVAHGALDTVYPRCLPR